MKSSTEVIFIPDYSGIEPYQKLLAERLRERNISVRLQDPLPPPGSFEHAKHRLRVAHLHWIHFFYGGRTAVARIKNGLSYLFWLVRTRWNGIKIVWTVHNLFPHDSPGRFWDWVMRTATAHLAHGLIVHSPMSRTQVQRTFFRWWRIQTVPIASDYAAYPPPGPREETRRTYSLPDRCTLYLFFGSIRKYKGIEDLIRAFQSCPGEDLRLMIAGMPVDQEYTRHIRAMAREDSRIVVDLREVRDSEVTSLLEAADAIVLPFRAGLTFASFMLALGAGKPLVASRVGIVRELLTDDMGISVRPGSLRELRQGLMDIRRKDPTLVRQAMQNLLKKHSWDVMARGYAGLYGRLSGLNVRSSSPGSA